MHSSYQRFKTTFEILRHVQPMLFINIQDSAHTSMKTRCEAAKSQGRVEGVISKQPKQLQRFVGNPRQNIPDGLPFRLVDYLELVDWTGRQIREDKRGPIDSDLPCILERLIHRTR